MPIPPDWSDVVFDHAAAEAAAAGCESMASQLRNETAERDRLAGRARLDWSGPHRDHFDASSAQLSRETADVAARLVTTAAAIRTAAVGARTEQGAREADRLRYEQQLQPELVAEAPRPGMPL